MHHIYKIIVLGFGKRDPGMIVRFLKLQFDLAPVIFGQARDHKGEVSPIWVDCS